MQFPPYRSILDSEPYPVRQVPPPFAQTFSVNDFIGAPISGAQNQAMMMTQIPSQQQYISQQRMMPPTLQRAPPQQQPQTTSAQNLNRTLEAQAMNNRINLSDMYLGDEAAKTIAKALQKYTSIQFLDLKGNNFSPQGLIPIFDALKNNFQLKSLNLEWNRLCTNDLAGMEALYRFLIGSRSLTHIDLKNNKINAAGCQILSNVFRSNNTLTSVDLRWNDIGNPGAQAILASIMDNRTLASLELGGNNVAEELLIKIANVVNSNRDQSHLRMRKIFVAQDGADNSNSNNNLGSSLNDRDLDFRSRSFYNSNQQQGGNYTSDAYYQNNMQQQIRNVRPFSSFSGDVQQQQPQQLPVRSGIPYEQEKIIAHLEDLIERERVTSLEMKNSLTQRINELRQSMETAAQRKADFLSQIAELQNENNALRTDLSRVETDLKAFEDKKKLEYSKREETAFQKDTAVRSRDKQMQEELLRLQEQHAAIIQNIDFESQKKCDILLQRLAKVKSGNDDIRLNLAKNDDLFYSIDLTAKEAALELVEKVKNTAQQQYNAKNLIMENRMNKLVKEKLEEESKVQKYINLNMSKCREKAEQFRMLQKDIYKYKLDNEDINQRNNDYDAVIKKMENDRKNQEKLAKKLENELQDLKKRIAESEDKEKKEKVKIEQDHKNSMNKIEQEHEIHRKRVAELERVAKDVHAVNYKLRQDYQRLQDLLQGNVSKAVFEAFKEKQVL